MSIIIVGNGTSVIDKKNGHKIDGFNTVLRFNSFKIDGYEDYTGEKTNIWFTVNCSHAKDMETFDEIIVHSWEWSRSKCKIYQKLSENKYPCGFAGKYCHKTDRAFVRSIPTRSPSTGLIAIYMMIERFNQVFITGFDWWEREKHHYGDSERRGTLHNPKEEYEIIRELSKQNKILFLN